jgi:hypothetical protein
VVWVRTFPSGGALRNGVLSLRLAAQYFFILRDWAFLAAVLMPFLPGERPRRFGIVSARNLGGRPRHRPPALAVEHEYCFFDAGVFLPEFCEGLG